MSAPTPPAWMLCDHRGIGLPGCPTCDGRLDPETIKERFALNNYVGFLLATLAHTERAVKEAQRIIEERASEPKEPIGIGPWTRIGGPMPEPWAGCSIEQDGVRMLVHRVAPGHGAVEWEMDAHTRIDIPSTTVTSLWDGRVCVWRAAP